MTILRTPAFLHYVLGLGAVAAGAAASASLDSMWPLALGASFAVMSTVGLVLELRARARASRARRQPPRG